MNEEQGGLAEWQLLDEDDEEEATLLLNSTSQLLGAVEDKQDVFLVVRGIATGSFFEVGEDGGMIGRSQDAMIALEDAGISRQHARLIRRGGMLWIEDLGSVNRTYVNGEPLVDAIPLDEGNHIDIGDCRLVKLSIDEGISGSFRSSVYRASSRDPEANVWTLDVLRDHLAREASFAKRHGRNLVLIAAEPAAAARVRRQLGLAASRGLLRRFAELVQRTVRAEDLIARAEADRVLILTRSTSEADAQAMMRRLGELLAHARVTIENSEVELAARLALTVVDPSSQPDAARIVDLALAQLDDSSG